MPITITASPLPTPSLLALLTSHLPHSLTVLRRLQFAANFPSTNTPHTHILHASLSPSSPPADEKKTNHFATAYVDLSRSPETECFLYCTVEDFTDSIDYTIPPVLSASLSEDDARVCEDLVLAILGKIRELEGEMDGGMVERRVGRGKMVLGSLEEGMRRRLVGRGVRMARTGVEMSPDVERYGWEFYGKWLFRVEMLAGEMGMGMGIEGARWDVVRREDVAVILARTKIPRQEATLLALPSTVVRLEDGTPVAWAFLGPDGTLTTLHVEESYRGKGLAKTLASKLMRDHLGDFGDDGWGAADVYVSNLQSQAVCRSLGGKVSKTVCWAILDLESVTSVL
ncbi:hypothetical protein QBC47DRAFT_388463 [Echria macrotheca]|uniref:N-acetyltransferase domain-containing protein n=1 Tax=Echria macrotheca TaxID=438768 RepID=A0AAJ0B685_9PEZI|nr:hypothetical protein QBC47DRAFT_388463 [Echria macrotheca]